MEIKKISSAEMKKKKEELKKNMAAMREKDAQLVKGKFIFHEVPGGVLSFSFKYWPDDDVINYTFTDNEIYSIPLGVAKHLNKNCWYPVHSYQQDENGKNIQKIGQKVRRCSFQSLEFVDEADLTPVGGAGIVSVEKVI
jgi:hypothetical protein